MAYRASIRVPLLQGVSDTDTSLFVQTALADQLQGFSTLILDAGSGRYEEVTVSSVNTSTGEISVSRGANGTTPLSHTSGGTTVRPLLAGGGEGGSAYVADNGGEPANAPSASAYGAVGIGVGHTVTGKYGFSAGGYTHANYGEGSAILGGYTDSWTTPNKIASNNRGGVIAGGNGNYISSRYIGFAAGYKNIVSGDQAAAVGYRCEASGTDSFASGYKTTASGSSAFAAGKSTASGAISAALQLSTATALYAFASGGHTYANGQYSTAMGGWNKAEGTGAVAAGGYFGGAPNVAYGNFSYAGGYGSYAYQDGSWARAGGLGSYGRPQQLGQPMKAYTSDGLQTAMGPGAHVGQYAGSVLGFKGQVAAVSKSGYAAHWELSGLAHNFDGTGAVLATYTVNKLSYTGGAGSLADNMTVSVAANGDAVEVSVTGAASEYIQWSGYLAGANVYGSA